MSVELARPSITSLRAYESARSLSTEGRVFLDANESPVSPIASLPTLNRYPEPQPRELVERLCGIYKVQKSELMVGRGSDEAIDLIVRVFCESGLDRILICPPTYGMYEISAKIQGAGIIRVPMKLDASPSLDLNGILSAIQEGVKVIFICSPNNPTGTPFSKGSLIKILEATLNRSIVVIDEAYAEFSKQESMLSEISRYPNLIVLRTLSKAWAIAGARCGVAIASPPLIELLQKVRAPYPISLPALRAILEGTTIDKQELLQNRVLELLRERELMVAELMKIPRVKYIFPSEANFLLVRFENSAPILTRMKQEGIILRDRSSEVKLEGCIRITLGTALENRSVIAELKGVLS